MLPVLLATASLPAQRAEVRADARTTGIVSGTVTCADTNLPARLADVALQPIRDPDAKAEAKGVKADTTPILIALHQTRLDGSFSIPAVPPGRYYVVANKPGYLSPASQFTVEEIEHPGTPELIDEIARAMPVVTVAAGRASSLDIRLRRAASISGTIRFDDGSAAGALDVAFVRRNRAGKWVHINLFAATDDQGHFRAAGLPAGEYRIHTDLSVMNNAVGALFSTNNMSRMNSYRSSLNIFFGDTFFQHDAKTLKLEDGQDATADITIPASKLHSVSGTLVDAKTGRTLNAGKIEVLEPGGPEPDDADDESNGVLSSVELAAEDTTYRLEYVPEGTLTFRVANAREITREPIPFAPGSFGIQNYKETVLRSYAPYEKPLVVTTDMQGVNLPIPPRDANLARPKTP